MEFDVYTFDKTEETREKEYKELLCSRELLPSSQMDSEWCYLADEILEPGGWQAMWIVSASQCKDLKLDFPSDFLVLVSRINSQTLSAEVNVLNMKEGINLPTPVTVPLIDLSVTKKQENEALFARETAAFIDKLRLFYSHLWMPWDIEDDDTQDWPSQHLESRLKLYYDMREGKMPPEMIFKIQYLMRKARRIQTRITYLEDQTDKLDDEVNLKPIMCELMDLHYTRNKIKNKFENFEDPCKRALLIWKQHNKMFDKCEKSFEGTEAVDAVVYVVSPGGNYEKFTHFLMEAEPLVNRKHMIVNSDLMHCLELSSPGDSVILASGSYGLLGLGGIEKGGTIQGLGSPESTVLVPLNAGSVLMNCNTGVITLENMTIDVQDVEIGIFVQGATLQLRNCHLRACKNSKSTGLVILNGSIVLARDCLFTGFDIAVLMYPEGEASFTSCCIKKCNVGVQLQESKLTLMKSTIEDCLEFGIKVEVNRQTSNFNKEIGSVVLLNGVGAIQMSDTNVEKNMKGDVCIFQGGFGDVDGSTLSFLQFNTPAMVNSAKVGGYGDDK